MAEEARGASRSQPAVEPGWEALLDPAMLEARLNEARERRRAALERRAAAAKSDADTPAADMATASGGRARRLQALDKALAGDDGTPLEAPRPRPARPVVVDRGLPERTPVDRARLDRTGPNEPTLARPAAPSAGSETSPSPAEMSPAAELRAAPRPLPAAVPRPAVGPAPAGGPSMPERLAAVIVPPVAQTVAAPAATAPRRSWTWAAPALGLLLGAGVALGAIWWQAGSREDATPQAEAPAMPQITAPHPTLPAVQTAAAPEPEAPRAIPTGPTIPGEPAFLPALPAAPAIGLPFDGEVPPALARVVLRTAGMPSIEATTAVSAPLVEAPEERAATALRFAGETAAPATTGRPALVLPGAGDLVPVVSYALPEPPEAAAPPAAPKVTPTRSRTRAPQAPVLADAAPAPPAAAPAAQATGIRNRLERAVESMLRNRILGQ